VSEDDAEKVIYALLEVAEAQQQAVTDALKALEESHRKIGKEARAASLEHALGLKKGLQKEAREAMAEGLKKGFSEVMPDIKRRLIKTDVFLIVGFFVSSFLGGVLAVELTRIL
jgi:hypothetical protein